MLGFVSLTANLRAGSEIRMGMGIEQAMSDRVMVGGSAKMLITDSFKLLLNRFVQKRYPNKQDIDEKKRVTKAVLAHEYLIDDPWHVAEQRYITLLAKRGRALLAGLEVRLKKNQVRHIGIESATGRPQLTAQKLVDHSLRILNLSGDWLLLSVKRHPTGGTGIDRRQYWLYDHRNHILRLLRSETVVQCEGEWRALSKDGVWSGVSDRLETDFFKMVDSTLGSEAVTAFRLSGESQDRLCNPPVEVSTECALICGFDYFTEERKRRHIRELECFKKYGERKLTAPTISMASGIELIYSD